MRRVMDGFRISTGGREIRGSIIIEDSILEPTRLTALINGQLVRVVFADRRNPNYPRIVGDFTSGLMGEMSRRINGRAQPSAIRPIVRRDEHLEAMALLTLLALQ